jgi:hypothetical protein
MGIWGPRIGINCYPSCFHENVSYSVAPNGGCMQATMGSSTALLGQVESFADMSAGACHLGSVML